MKYFNFKAMLAVSASSAMLAGAMATPAFAQSTNTSVAEDEIITIGTRRKARSAADVIAPVDVIPATELLNHCLLYTSPSPRDATLSRMPSSA